MPTLIAINIVRQKKEVMRRFYLRIACLFVLGEYVERHTTDPSSRMRKLVFCVLWGGVHFELSTQPQRKADEGNSYVI